MSRTYSCLHSRNMSHRLPQNGKNKGQYKFRHSSIPAQGVQVCSDFRSLTPPLNTFHLFSSHKLSIYVSCGCCCFFLSTTRSHRTFQLFKDYVYNTQWEWRDPSTARASADHHRCLHAARVLPVLMSTFTFAFMLVFFSSAASSHH